MNLLSIKQYLSAVKVSTLGNLCRAFATDPDTMRCMMQHWLRKGNVRQCLRTPHCGSSCFQCAATFIEMYEWVDGDHAAMLPLQPPPHTTSATHDAD